MMEGMPLSFNPDSPPHALIRCDGSSEVGMGHVVRCLALADVLRGEYGWQISFFMRQGPLGIGEVQKRGYVVHSPDQGGGVEDSSWFARVVSRISGDVLIGDVRDDLQKEALHDFRRNGLLIALLDDLTERRLAADLVFYPPIPQLDGLDWKGYTGRLFVGWEWVVLRRDVRLSRRTRVSHRPLIVITMGGSDPSGFTLKAVQAIEHVRQDVDVTVVLGPGFRHGPRFAEVVETVRRPLDIRTDVMDLPELMAQADMVVGAFGTTAYEAAVIGARGIFLCSTDDHAESAIAFMNAGFGVSMGLGSHVSEKELGEKIDQELGGKTDRSITFQPAKPAQVIDGFGAERVAERIVLAVQERNKSYEAVGAS